MRAALALLLAACATPPTEMRVSLFPPAYSAAMSSTPGLGMTPISEPPKGVSVRYRWTASEGFFVTQDDSTLEISVHGRDFLTMAGKVYWSYDPNIQTGRGPKPVHITVRTENAKNDALLAVAEFDLTFDGTVFRAAH